MPARVKIDAFPEMKLTGKVHKVAVLAKSEWFNPDLKEYETTISIDGVHPSLKPGMSAEVEILVGTLRNVIRIPIQAVTARAGNTVVFLLDGSGNEEVREVVTGEANESFVEIKSGLVEGDVVLLEAPQTIEPEEGEDVKRPDKDVKDSSGPPSGANRTKGTPPSGAARDGKSRSKGGPRKSGRPPRGEKKPD